MGAPVGLARLRATPSPHDRSALVIASAVALSARVAGLARHTRAPRRPRRESMASHHAARSPSRTAARSARHPWRPARKACCGRTRVRRPSADTYRVRACSRRPSTHKRRRGSARRAHPKVLRRRAPDAPPRTMATSMRGRPARAAPSLSRAIRGAIGGGLGTVAGPVTAATPRLTGRTRGRHPTAAGRPAATCRGDDVPVKTAR